MSQDLEQNKRTAVAFYELAFNRSQPAEAMSLYGGPTYRQHNPETRDGREGFIDFVTGFGKRFPHKKLDIRHVLAEGDRVVLHVFARLFPEDRGAAIFDMFRFENGKIVEHWDAIQPIPEHSENGNGMF
ncbi:MAG TPA: nuclear transport factor 2 family protein [Steroidobacteraceae bacterium]|nr:nuclear transport factor 2 family protein [Steroidobacteraceae bacterium]